MACGVSRIYKELVVWGWDEQASIWDRHVDVSYKEASLCWTDSYQNEIVVMPIGFCIDYYHIWKVRLFEIVVMPILLQFFDDFS